MNPKAFVDAIKIAVLRDAAEGTMQVLERPPGRRPASEIQELSKWFQRLSATDRDALAKVTKFAARQAVHNFLALLDGIAAFEPIGPKGKLELYYVKDGSRTLLNDENAEELTSLFKEESQ